MTDEKPHGDDFMEAIHQSPEAGLELVLALRPADLDGWESSAALDVTAGVAEQIRLRDTRFTALLAEWSEEVSAGDVPDVRGSDFVGLPQEVAPRVASPLVARRPIRRLRPSGFFQAAALAAGFSLLCFGSWQLQKASQGVPSETSTLPGAGWKAVSGAVPTRVELQFSVERRTTSGASVEPGRAGALYGAADSLILRVDLRGEPAWVYLFEQTGSGDPVVLHPSSPAGWRLQEGLHALSSPDGEPLAYRPDYVTGPTRYLAVATAEPIEAALVASQVLASGIDRPDLWPRSVRAVDSFVVDWME